MELLKLEIFTQEILESLLLSNLEESINIEFKSAKSLSKEPAVKKEISKDISSFANSDGGIIFYGIDEENHIATSFSFIDGNIFTKEWLENIIISNIQNRIEDLKITPVRFDNDIKQTIYVVKIPQSNHAPHINGDKKYYRRYNFQSVPMEEYEIRNLYLRQKISKVYLDRIVVKPDKSKTENIWSFYVELQVINDGCYVSDKYKIACNFENAKGISVNYDRSKNYNVTNKLEGGVKISTNECIPLFPDEILNALSFNIEIPIERFDEIIGNMKCTFLTFNTSELEENETNLPKLLVDIKETYYNNASS